MTKAEKVREGMSSAAERVLREVAASTVKESIHEAASLLDDIRWTGAYDLRREQSLSLADELLALATLMREAAERLPAAEPVEPVEASAPDAEAAE